MQGRIAAPAKNGAASNTGFLSHDQNAASGGFKVQSFFLVRK